MKTKHIFVTALAAITLSSCNGFLDQDPDSIYPDEVVFGDANMIESVLSNLYSRVNYGMNLNDSYSFTYIDEAAKMDGGPDERSTYEDNLWRVYDYEFVRDCNQFLAGLKKSSALSEAAKKPLEGEVRATSTWCAALAACR